MARAWGSPLFGLMGCLALAACSGGGAPDAGFPDAEIIVDAEAPDAGSPDTTLISADAMIVLHDAGGPLPCNTTCECAQGYGCIGGVCRATGSPIYCCANPGCPVGAACLTIEDRPATCVDTSRPDAGPPPDAGPGQIGAYCEADLECDQSMGLTCWERNEPPYMWGHCTLDGCGPNGVCPLGNECIQFNIPPPNGPVLGCMRACAGDGDCRADAYCLPIPSAPFFGVCFPDCRDDLYDCAPRDGTQYCSPMSGQCEATPMQSATARAGDACTDNTQCGAGQICMGEIAWGVVGGVCTRVCSGLPEATSCEAGETCQSLLGIGLCFRNCEAGGCPRRANAICGVLDPSWSTPSCVPQ